MSLKCHMPYWTLQQVSESVLFSILFEGPISGPYLRILGEQSIAKNYSPALSVVGKVFEKLRFRSSWSTSYLLIVISDRVAGAFNRSGATRAGCSFWHIQGFWQDVTWWCFQKLHSYGIAGLSFLSNRQLQVVLT